MKIRKAKKTDIKQIAGIYKKIYSEKPYLEKWKEGILIAKINENIHWQKVLVVEINKKIEGFIIAYTFHWFDGLRGYIEDFGINPKCQKRGFGKKLFNEMSSQLEREGVKKILLDVNKKAKVFKFYKKEGYKKTDYIKLEKTLK